MLFVDIVDFTPYAEQADPEQARGLQTGLLRHRPPAGAPVRRGGREVHRRRGDGALRRAGGHRERRAALRTGRPGAATAPGPAARRTAAAAAASGSASPPARRWSTSSAARDGGQAFVTGDVVNTASRLQSLAPTGGVVVDESTWAATRHEMEYADQPPVTLRGRSTVSRIWLAVRAPHRSGDLQRRRADPDGRPGPRAGPAGQRPAPHASTSAPPQLVTVFGPAGVGKSRLLRELARHAASLPGPAGHLAGRPVPAVRRERHLRRAGRHRQGAGPGMPGHRRPGRARATGCGHGSAELADPRRGTAGRRARPAARPARRTADPGRDRGGLAAVPARPGRGRARPCWSSRTCTGPTRRCCASSSSSARRPATCRCWSSRTARPELRERHPAWTGTISGAMSISVPPMHDADIDTLYSLLLGQAALPADARTPLIEFADGNPLYAQEYARMLLDGGLLRRRPAPDVDPAGVRRCRDTVQAVIANRLDLLDPADRAVLQAAAVVGRAVLAGGGGRRAGPAGRDWVERALGRLEQRDLVHEQPASTMAGQPEYRFRHILVRDVCYQRLPRAERVLRHQRTADWLEQVADGRQHDLAEVLANHRWAAHEIARTLGLDTAPLRRRRPGPRCTARPAGRTRCTRWTPPRRWSAGRWRCRRAARDPALELFDAELAFYRDGDAFLVGGGAQRLTAAGRAAGRRPATGRRGARLDAAGHRRLAPGRPGRDAALPGPGDRALRRRCRTPRRRRAPCWSWPGCTCSTRRPSRPCAAARRGRRAGRAAGPDRGHARTPGSPWPWPATRPACTEAYAELAEVTEHCRADRLASRRRAVHNLAWALQEEGDLAGSARLVEEQRRWTWAASTALATSFADQWAAVVLRRGLAGGADAGGRVDPPARPPSGTCTSWRSPAGCGRCATSRTGRRDRSDRRRRRGLVRPGASVAARRSGFHRVLRSTLAHAALCRAVQGRTGRGGGAAGRAGGGLAADPDDPVRRVGAGDRARRRGAARRGRRRAGPRRCSTAAPRRTPGRSAAGRSAEAALARRDGDAARAAGCCTGRGRGVRAGCRRHRPDDRAALAVGRWPSRRPAGRRGDPRTGARTVARPPRRRRAARHRLAGCRLLGAGRAAAGGGCALDLLGVHVDVLAAGQLHQLVHDLVGDRALDEPVTGHPRVAGEVQRRRRTGSAPA